MSKETLSEEEIWNKRIKDTLGLTKSKLMFDFSTCDEKQKQFMGKILFQDSTSIEYWLEYVKCVAEKNDNYNSISRLLNIVFQMIDTVEESSDKFIIDLYLFKAKYLRKHGKDPRKTFQEMERKKIGMSSSEFYSLWADCEKAYDPDNAKLILKKAAVSVVPRAPTTPEAAVFDDGEVVIEKEQILSCVEEEEEDATVTVAIEPVQTASAGNSEKAPPSTIPKSRPSAHLKIGRALRVPPSVTGTSHEDEDDLSAIVVFKDRHTESKRRSDADMCESSDDGSTATTSSTVQDANAGEALSVSSKKGSIKSATNKSALNLKAKYIDDRLQNFDKFLESARVPTSSKRKKQPRSEQNEHGRSPVRPEKKVRGEGNQPQSSPRSSVSSISSVGLSECDTEQQDFVTARDEPDAQNLKPSDSVDERRSKKRVSFSGKTEEVAEESCSDNDVTAEEKVKTKKIKTLRGKRSSESQEDDLSISLKPTSRNKSLEKFAKAKPSGSSLSSFENCQYLHVNDKRYVQLDGVIGRGASSSVCRVLSLPTASIYAFKKVDVRSSNIEDADEVLESYTNEINLLNQCKGSPYIIDLIDYEVNREQLFVAMVMEMGEIDLATSIVHQKKVYSADHPNSSKVNPFFMRMVWERMLLAVDFLHEHRIVHGDLKPANFVFVKGQLKLIDFGISKEISGDTTNIVRSGIIGTVNYMAPEAVMPSTCSNKQEDSFDESESPSKDRTVIKHGRASDIWSLGCILYQMLYGKTPFSSCRNPHQKIMLIANPKAEIPFDRISEDLGIQVARSCLIRDVTKRASIRGPSGLLNHPFLTSHLKEPTRDISIDTSDLQLKVPSLLVTQEQNISLPQVQRIVKLVLDNSCHIEAGKLKTEDLCQQVLDNLYSKNEPPKSLPLRKIFEQQSENIAPPQKLPQNLKDQLQFQSESPSKADAQCPDSKRHFKPKLQQVLRSNSAKWMRPKGSTPEKKDMKSLLERQLGTMRKFLEHETDDTVGSAFDVQDEFSFQNF